MIIDTQLQDDIFRLEREYFHAMAETDYVFAMIMQQRGKEVQI